MTLEEHHLLPPHYIAVMLDLVLVAINGKIKIKINTRRHRQKHGTITDKLDQKHTDTIERHVRHHTTHTETYTDTHTHTHKHTLTQA